MFKNYFVLTLLLLSSLCCCTRQPRSDKEWYEPNGRVKVLTTIAMIHDLVKTIGGEEVDSILLIRAELDPHSYELVKGDDEKFAMADIIFYNGLGLEHGLSLRQHLENHSKAIAVANPLLNLPGAVVEVDGQYDPHVWMDISLWMQTIGPIVEALSKKDPAHAMVYRERGENLKKIMQESDERAYQMLQEIDGTKRYLVTSHDAFHYFTRRYLAEKGEIHWQLRCKAPEGLAPEAQMSVNDVIAVTSHIEMFKIRVLFSESNVSKDSLRKILSACKEKGVDLKICQDPLYSDSMGSATSYLDMIKHNIEIIAKELKQ